jgi:hypothetical protein
MLTLPFCHCVSVSYSLIHLQGKSHLIHELMTTLKREANKVVHLAAPTGIAAANIGGRITFFAGYVQIVVHCLSSQ